MILNKLPGMASGPLAGLLREGFGRQQAAFIHHFVMKAYLLLGHWVVMP